MPYKIASDTFDSIGTAGPYNRVLDNGRGGSATLTHSATASPSLKGEGDGDLAWNNQTTSSAHVPVGATAVFGANLEFKPNGTAPSVFVSVLNGTTGAAVARVHHTGAYFINGTTLQIRTVANNGTTATRAAATPLGAAVTGTSLLSIEKTLDNLSWLAKLTDVATGNVLASVPWVPANIAEVNGGSAIGQGVGYGFAGAASLPARLSGIDILGYAVPVLSGPTGSATGSTAAQGKVTTDIGNGTMYVAAATTDLTAAQIKAANITKTVTAAGDVVFDSVPGLTANTTGYKLQYVHVADVGESAIVRSAAFNTPSPLAAPAGTSATDVQGGKVFVIYTPSGGPVASATAALPAHATPNGAVSEAAKAMTFGGGVWTAEFTPVPGDYAAPVVLASNSDNPSVTITGASAFSILDATGTATPGADTQAPTLTSPTLNSDEPGTISASVTTDEGNGTMYVVVTNTSTKPSAAQVKAGQSNGGTAAPWARSTTVLVASNLVQKAAHSLSAGNWYAHFMHEDAAGNQSLVATSSAFSIGDTIAPTLSSPTGTATAFNAASGTVSTNEGNGTLYWLVSESGTAAASAVKAGSSKPVTATGVQSVTASGLAGSTSYFIHYLHRDAAGNDSTVITSAAFSTPAAPDVTAPTLSSPTGTATAFNAASGTVSTNEGNGTLYWLASTNATETAAAVKAGSNKPVTATGAQSVTSTGLSGSTSGYRMHYLHRDAAGNDSTVSSSAAFSTPAAPDTTAPTLSAATASASSDTSSVGGVSTNEGNGTLYWLTTTAASPTATEVKAGSNKAVSATGTQSTTSNGLQPSTQYKTFFLHRDAAGNDSTVLASAAFTTQATPQPGDPVKTIVGLARTAFFRWLQMCSRT